MAGDGAVDVGLDELPALGQVPRSGPLHHALSYRELSLRDPAHYGTRTVAVGGRGRRRSQVRRS